MAIDFSSITANGLRAVTGCPYFDAKDARAWCSDWLKQNGYWVPVYLVQRILKNLPMSKPWAAWESERVLLEIWIEAECRPSDAYMRGRGAALHRSWRE